MSLLKETTKISCKYYNLTTFLFLFQNNWKDLSIETPQLVHFSMPKKAFLSRAEWANIVVNRRLMLHKQRILLYTSIKHIYSCHVGKLHIWRRHKKNLFHFYERRGINKNQFCDLLPPFSLSFISYTHMHNNNNNNTIYLIVLCLFLLLLFIIFFSRLSLHATSHFSA